MPINFKQVFNSSIIIILFGFRLIVNDFFRTKMVCGKDEIMEVRKGPLIIKFTIKDIYAINPQKCLTLTLNL